MKGHAGHLYRHPGRLAAAGQRDVQQPRRLLGVGVKHLVKISHAVKQQGVGVIRLEAQVLGHHRRVGRQCHADGGFGGVRFFFLH